MKYRTYKFPVNNCNEVARNSLFGAFIQLMDQKPINQITVLELCQKANISRSAFYWNFSSKEDMLRKYFDGQLYSMVRHLHKAANHSRVNTLEYLVVYFSLHKQLVNALIVNHLETILTEHLATIVQEILKQNLLREIPSVEFEVQFLASGLTGIIITWSRHNYQEDDQQIVSIIKDLLK
ncbi:TetR/AcrR family transcriptional regulator [Lapidilactobacillus dextrinicus]|uniref:TetR/AcrR family transcriptional regulator n=1 Tax=Lapidilactobacillus dextrinicus TaxID=51664 RepID=UPI003F23E3AC